MSIVWKEENGQVKAFAEEKGLLEEAVWAPMPGSQEAFLTCPVLEALYEGTRGPGKTDAVLMAYCQHVGTGWGPDWRGIIFRQSYPDLADIIAKGMKWIPRIWPEARFNKAKTVWTFPEGEQLLFRFMRTPEDYNSYHGHAYPFIGWEELTSWANDSCYKSMFSCCRSAVPGIPKMVRATTNPYGIGHQWVKSRFRLPLRKGQLVGPIIKTEGKPDRVAIHGDLRDNIVLSFADPDYIKNIRAGARNEAEARAWIFGDWNIVAGGMFDDVWAPGYHVVPTIPFDKIPKRWRIDRSYDHGQSKPFSVGWWAESNGEPIIIEDQIIGPISGDLIRIAEWYGWDGATPNVGRRMLSREIAKGINKREKEWGISDRVKRGPADSSIFADYEPGKSVAGYMKKEGVYWSKTDKGPGSRKHGWETMREYFFGAVPGREGVREKAGLFVTERCDQFIRTIPALPRSKKDMDDVDTESEDHIADEVRYRLRSRSTQVEIREW